MNFLAKLPRANRHIINNWNNVFAPSVVSGSSPVIAHMIATGGLHDR
jgi:hypothetical protein